MYFSNCILFIKDRFEVVKAETNTFSNCLGGITTEEDILLSHGHQKRYCVLGQVLNFVNHQEVHLRCFRHIILLKLSQYVIDYIVLIICTEVLLPLLILEEDPVDG